MPVSEPHVGPGSVDAAPAAPVPVERAVVPPPPAPIAASGRRWRDVLTPEGVPLAFEVSPLSDRVLAFAIDFALIQVTAIAVLLLGLWLTYRTDSRTALSLGLLLSFVIRNTYFIFFETRWNGSTPGKRALRLRVVSSDGGSLTAQSVVARNLTREVEIHLPLLALVMPNALFPGLPAWAALVGGVWLLALAALPLTNRHRRRIGDMIGGTLVIRMPAVKLLADLAGGGAAINGQSSEVEAPSPLPAPLPDPLPPDTPGLRGDGPQFSSAQLDVYGIHELQVLERLLRQDPDMETTQEAVAAVEERIKRKIGWQADPTIGDAGDQAGSRDFLLAFYAAQRGRLEQRLLMGERRERKSGAAGAQADASHESPPREPASSEPTTGEPTTRTSNEPGPPEP